MNIANVERSFIEAFDVDGRRYLWEVVPAPEGTTQVEMTHSYDGGDELKITTKGVSFIKIHEIEKPEEECIFSESPELDAFLKQYYKGEV
jgi:hypothetical protein